MVVGRDEFVFVPPSAGLVPEAFSEAKFEEDDAHWVERGAFRHGRSLAVVWFLAHKCVLNVGRVRSKRPVCLRRVNMGGSLDLRGR